MKILQIGRHSWADQVEELPKELEWYCTGIENLPSYLEELIEETRSSLPPVGEGQSQPKSRLRFDVIMITEVVDEADLEPLVNMVEPYGLYVDQGINLAEGSPYGIYRRKCLRELEVSGDILAKMEFLQLTHFGSQYGAKLKLPDIDVSENFKGQVFYDGHVAIHLKGDFGQDFQPLLTFRYNLGTFPVALEIWQEYFKVSGNPEIRMEITPMRKGSLHDYLQPIFFRGGAITGALYSP